MKTLKITTDNKISIINVNLDDYRALQQEIGGYIETVHTQIMYDYFKAPVLMLVDEEGLIKNLDVVIKRFNRIGSEGLASHTVEGESQVFAEDDFAEYEDDIQAYLDSLENATKGKVRFL